jgi:hypothetical protein
VTGHTLALLALLLLLGEPTAWASTLDDFKEAAGKTGCESIPYTDQRSTCGSQQSDVHSYCDGERGPVSCELGVTQNLTSQLVREHKDNDELKSKRRDLDDKRSHASNDQEKSQLTSQIEAVDKDIEGSVATLKTVTGDAPRGTGRRGLRQRDRTACR